MLLRRRAGLGLWRLSLTLRRGLALGVAVGAMHCSSAGAWARGYDATPTQQADSNAEQVIVTGTRDPSQTARHSVSPVVVVSGEQLRATGMTDIRDALTQLVPSVSRQVMGLDQGSLTDSLSLRGLNADQTLVLVNGKRRHTTAALSFDGGPQQGTTPVDMDMIPMSAIDHIEILEDGASAQYGSDAIAGVINIILKSNKSGITAQAVNGGYYAGDGFTTGEIFNAGMDLGGRGFLNVSAEVKHQDRTVRVGADSRTGQKDNAAIGSPQVTREGIAVNFGYHITPDIEIYSFDTYTHRDAERWAYLRTASSLPEVYPTGYTPTQTMPDDDFGVTVGVRGKKLAGWSWDLSTTYGEDHDSLGLYNSANIDLYHATGYTPQRFHIGSFSNSQWTTNFDLRRSFNVPLLAKPLNLALGAEYRYDSYAIGQGDAASYAYTGSQGYQGLSPANVVNASRDVTAGYIDVSTQLLPKWQVDFAGRFEHYTDVGDTETGKVSSRYDFNRFFAIRGTVSNGFRAPTLAEEHYANIVTSPSYANAQLPVSSPGARYLGASALKPERSTNFSAGFLLNPLRSLHITLDAYQISVRDRIVDGAAYNGQDAMTALALDGASVQEGIDPTAVSAQYFTNGASTRTRGMDITATYDTNFGRYGKVRWDAAVNFTHTSLTNVGRDANGNSLVNAQQAAYLTTAYPANKLIFGGAWRLGRWDASVHEIRYGHTTSQLTYYTGPNAFSVTNFMEFVNSPRWVTNLEVGYQLTPIFHIALGANNVGNAYPRRLPSEVSYLNVARYDTYSQQLGQDGGFYYLRLNLKL